MALLPLLDSSKFSSYRDPARLADWRLQIGWTSGVAGKLHFSQSDPFFGSTDAFASQWTEYFSGPYDDVTNDVYDGSQVSWSRGSDQQVVAQLQAGESSFQLMNIDTPQLYDPNDPSGPIYLGGPHGIGVDLSLPHFIPMRPVRLIASLDGWQTTIPCFYHFIVEADYDPNTFVCTLTCQDLCKWLDRFQPVIAAQSGISSSQAIGLVLDAVGFKDPGFRSLEPAPAVTGITFSADGSQTALSLIQTILDAERGYCWIDGAGVFRFEGRYARDARVVATRSFQTSLVGLSSKISIDQIANTATVTATSTGNPQTAQDVGSVAVYGASTIADVSSDYILDDAHARDLAALIVLRSKDQRPPMVATSDNPDAQTITDQLGVDINQRVTIDVSGDFFVERVDQKLDAGGMKLTTEMTVTTAPATEALLFGASPFFGTTNYFG